MLNDLECEYCLFDHTEITLNNILCFVNILSSTKALQSVQQKSREIEKMGMSASSFGLGLLNVVASSFVLGRWPEHFWVWTAVTVGPMLVWTFYDKIKSRTHLYMLDFCWIANILLSIFSVLCFAQIFAGFEAFGYTHSRHVVHCRPC